MDNLITQFWKISGNETTISVCAFLSDHFYFFMWILTGIMLLEAQHYWGKALNMNRILLNERKVLINNYPDIAKKIVGSIF